MANTKASQKDIRKTASRTARNRAMSSRLKTLAKRAHAPASGEAEQRQYISALDKGVKSGLIHRNKANRQKARLARKAAGASAS